MSFATHGISVRHEVQQEFEELLTFIDVDDEVPQLAVNAEIMQKAKGILCVFSVAQSTARKLTGEENRANVVKVVLDNAKKSEFWETNFSKALCDDIDNFLAASEADAKKNMD